MIDLRAIRMFFFSSLLMFAIGCGIEVVAARLPYIPGYPLAVAGMFPLIVGFLGSGIFGLIYLLESTDGRK